MKSEISNGVKGFTLIEVLAATFIITIGAGASFALVQRTVGFTTNAAFQFEASYLAQEGMEIVRNIRDANFLKIHKGVVPPYSVVVPGSLPGKEGAPSLYCVVIVKQVDEKTRSKTSINDLLRN